MNAELLLKEINEYKDELIAIRREIHANPEVGFELHKTKAYVKSKLEAWGYDVQECGKAGLVTTVGHKEGKVFLLRADMDALAMSEESGESFAATNGNMHACGHDFHTTMLLGAAKYLKQHEDEIQGVIKLMFQPAEEIFEGAKDMIKNGVLENPHVDNALMVHVAANLPMEEGTVLISAPGISAPAADYFDIEIQGKGAHGSSPNVGVDPINVAAHIIVALQEINAREISLNDDVVLTIGKITGATASNVIPDKIVLGGTLRTYNEEVRANVKERIVNIAKGISMAFRAEASVAFTSGCPTLKNDAAMEGAVANYLQELLGPYKAIALSKMAQVSSKGGGGSEDFAYISQEVPSLMLALAAGQTQKGYVYAQHNPKVRFDENALTNGCAALTYAALRFLEENK